MAELGNKPNIVFIVSDQHRAGLTKRSGYPLGLVLNDLAHQLRAPLAESFKRLVDIVNGEHDAEVA